MRTRLLVYILATIQIISLSLAHATNPETPAENGSFDPDYQSPYSFVASVTAPDLTSDFEISPRAQDNADNWSITPFSEWYNFTHINDIVGKWGPWFTAFSAPQGWQTKPLSWFQERLVAAGNEIRGTIPYAHHHMHTWDVPDTAPWTDNGYWPGKGIDCSDFTNWMFNYGLGIVLKTDVAKQAEMTEAVFHVGNGDYVYLSFNRLYDVQNGYDKDYQTLIDSLRPGDLLYIRDNPALTNPVDHVILWLGDLAVDSNNQGYPLVFDSHGQNVVDSNGNTIPTGPQIRPFRPESYYYDSFDHVLRLNFPTEPWGQVQDLGNDWEYSPWFGFIYSLHYPWVFSNDFDTWVFSYVGAPSSFFFYVTSRGWIWTNAETFPFIYDFTSETWDYISPKS